MTRPLPNYIRTFRKRSGLSQEEMAFLLGLTSGTSVLRHEDGQRVPMLDTALAYSVICRVDARELFAGRYVGAEVEVRKRARKLLAEAVKQKQAGDVARKAVYLAALVNDPALHYVPVDDD
jgi:DNA-binding XRE family transcriptional regulator